MPTQARPRSSSPKRVRYPQDPATAYARKVVAGKVIAGRLVQRACERHLQDLATASGRGLRWDVGAVARVIEYFSAVLRLNGGEHEGKPFVPSDWQCFILGSLFGWLNADGYRRYRVAYVEVAKGNGKSPLGAGIGLYCLTSDNEPRAEVYAAATKKDQAMILFRDAVAMVDQSPELSIRTVKSGTNPTWNLAYLPTHSFFRPISSDEDSQSGPRPHCGLLDELHEHKTDVVVDMMRAGTKGRRQALIFEITNSGFDRESICWRHHQYSRQVLEGTVANDGWFAYVATLDEDEDYRDERVWRKANPNLGVSVTPEYLRELVREAEGMPAKQNTVKRLNFCIWTEQADRWLDLDTWDRNADDVPDEELLGRPCFGALDLATTIDTVSLELVFPLADGRFVVRSFFWCPDERIVKRSRKDGVPYDAWRDQGLLTATPGNVVDYKVIRATIHQCAERYDMKRLGYDPWNATSLVTDLQDEGVPAEKLVEFRQGFASMSEPTKALESELLEGRILHGGHPILRWMAANVAVREDPAGNLKPDKERSREKIDGIVALIMALGLARAEPEPAVPVVWSLGG